MPIARTSRAVLLAGVTLFFPISAFAQTVPTTDAQSVPPSTDPATAAPTDAAQAPVDQAAPGGDVIVTGSRIARPDFEAPNPIVSFNATNIQQSGNTNLTDFLQRVPALTGSRDRADTSGGNGTYGSFGQTGLNELNLRNLGTNRTLVLVNGRRHVAGEANTAAVDINSIPTDLIERVDVLTGAVGAIYGADGVTGVVNFILKRDFEGLTGRAQIGVSDYGDAGNHFASLAAGKNFGGGRGNMTLTYEYNSDDAVRNDDRPFLTFAQRKYLIPNDGAGPSNILVGQIRYGGESPLGYVFVGGNANQEFDGLGRPYDSGTPAAYYQVGGVGSEVAGFYQGDLFPKTERHAVNLLSHYDFSDAFKLSVEAKYVQNRASSFGQITGSYGIPISINNPYIPTSIYAAAISGGTTVVGPDGVSTFTPASISVSRDNFDYGRPGEEDLRRTYRGVVDASGRISEHATWDAYYEYGRTTVRTTKIGDRLAKQYTDAIDAVRNPATGQIVCNPANNPTTGCIPISLFGAGPATPEQLAYFRVSDVNLARIEQHVASASISGDFGQFFALPGGPIKFAFGGEYRRESSRFDPDPRFNALDPVTNTTGSLFFQYDEPALVQPSRGHFDVKEAFGEIDLPLLRNVPFANVLSVGAAGRYSDYSTVGSTNTWQFNGTWAPIRDITFRGSYGRSVRAPNIGELFQPTSSTSAFFTDPCTPDQINNGTRFRAANCAATLAAVGAVSRPGLQTGNFVNGTSTGNRNLDPEVAKTWTAGVLLRPSFLPGFNAAIDWYDIKLTGAINTVDPNGLAVQCVDQPTVPNQFCNQFTRAQGTGIITGFTVGPLNVAQFRTAGLDVNINYVFRVAGAGTFDLRFVGGYLDKLEQVGIPGAPATNNVDQAGSPQYTANFSPTWTLGGLAINYNLRWNDKTLTYDRNTIAADPNVVAAQYFRYSALWQHDAQVRYQLDNGFAFYVGVNNFTNQKPDAYSYGTSTPISPLGRVFYAGAKFNLGR
ncbi:TonB-dependent receptor plug domain-containing protein [Sphingomonas sp.]|uniref:TonB-dependent receptor plug domain-containing protein n=1 Tax=Sphingomonas sp. TaxID=28214 RepID=UPI003B00EDAE